MKKGIVAVTLALLLLPFLSTEAQGLYSVSNSNECTRQGVKVVNWPKVMSDAGVVESEAMAMELMGNMLQCFETGFTGSQGRPCAPAASGNNSEEYYQNRPSDSQYKETSYNGWKTAGFVRTLEGRTYHEIYSTSAPDVLAVQYVCGSTIGGACSNVATIMVKVTRSVGETTSCPNEEWSTYQVMKPEQACETGWTEVDGSAIVGNPYTVSNGFSQDCKLCQQGAGQKMWSCHPIDGVKQTDSEYTDTDASLALCATNAKRFWWTNSGLTAPTDLICSPNQAEIVNCVAKEKKKFFYCDVDGTIKETDIEYTNDLSGKNGCGAWVYGHYGAKMYNTPPDEMQCYENESDLGFCGSDGCPPRAEVEEKGYIYTGSGASYNRVVARGGKSKLYTLINDALYSAMEYGADADAGFANITAAYLYRQDVYDEEFDLTNVDDESSDDNLIVGSEQEAELTAKDPYVCGIKVESLERGPLWYCDPANGIKQSYDGCVDEDGDGNVDADCSYTGSSGEEEVAGVAGEPMEMSGYPKTEAGKLECSYNIWNTLYKGTEGYANWDATKPELQCYEDVVLAKEAVPNCVAGQLWYCDPDSGPTETNGGCVDLVKNADGVAGGDGLVDEDCGSKCKKGDPMGRCGYQANEAGLQACSENLKTWVYEAHEPPLDWASASEEMKKCYETEEKLVAEVPECKPVQRYYCDPGTDTGAELTNLQAMELKMECPADGEGKATRDCTYQRQDGTTVTWCASGAVVANCSLRDSGTLEEDCRAYVETQIYDVRGKTAPAGKEGQFYSCYETLAEVDEFCKKDTCESMNYGTADGFTVLTGQSSQTAGQTAANATCTVGGISESHWIPDNLKNDGSGEYCYKCDNCEGEDLYIDEKYCIEGADEYALDQTGTANDGFEVCGGTKRKGGDACTIYVDQEVKASNEWGKGDNYSKIKPSDAVLCQPEAGRLKISTKDYFRYFDKTKWRTAGTCAAGGGCWSQTMANSEGRTSVVNSGDCSANGADYVYHLDGESWDDGLDNSYCVTGPDPQCEAGWHNMDADLNENTDPMNTEDGGVVSNAKTAEYVNLKTKSPADGDADTARIPGSCLPGVEAWCADCGESGGSCTPGHTYTPQYPNNWIGSHPNTYPYDEGCREDTVSFDSSGSTCGGWYDDCHMSNTGGSTGEFHRFTEWDTCLNQKPCVTGSHWESEPCEDGTGDCGHCQIDSEALFPQPGNVISKPTDCKPSDFSGDQKATGCQATRRCGRQLIIQPTKVEKEFNFLPGGCAEGDMFTVKLSAESSGKRNVNEAECARESVEMSAGSGGKMTHSFNPCSCKATQYEVEVTADDGTGSQVNFAHVTLPGTSTTIPGDKCTVLWHQLNARDGVAGAGGEWGSAGKNGHWILDGINDGSGNRVEGKKDGWEFDEASCKFVCAGDGSGEGVDCYDKVLQPLIYFVPDFRFVAYQDENRVASYLPDNDDNPSGQNNACSVGGSEVGTGSGVFDEATYDFNEGEEIGVYKPNFQDSMNGGGFREMYFGEELAAEISIRAQFQNTTGGAESQTTVDCTCPNLTLSDSSGGTTGEFGNCSYDSIVFNNAADVCTTKRLYAMVNEDYTSAWWQVSGGNVYAFGDIKDRIPNNVTELEGTQCVDVAESAWPVGAKNDFAGIAGYSDVGAAADESCTPRILRGRTPCKVEGPSNSAGVVLTQVGSINTFNDRDDNVTDKTGVAAQRLGQRYAERSNAHALFAGVYAQSNEVDIDNSSNKNGLQARIGSSNAKPVGEGISYDEGLNQMTGNPSDLGYVPPREDFNYFLNLVNSAAQVNEGVQIGQGGRVATSRHLSELVANKDSQCVKMQESNNAAESYVCYIDATSAGDLVIDASNPWTLSKGATFEKFTVFVQGNVIIRNSGGYDNNNASIAVNVGNFLSLIVSGNVTVEPDVGLTLPNPYNNAGGLNADVGQCWEGQSAAVGGTIGYAPTGVAANSAAGVTEGIFIADGNLTIQRDHNAIDCLARTDKRYIHQGSMIVWGNATLERDFSNRERDCRAIAADTTQDDAFGIYNNRIPAETFIYRPDLVVNIPSWMRRSTVYTYQE